MARQPSAHSDRHTTTWGDRAASPGGESSTPVGTMGQSTEVGGAWRTRPTTKTARAAPAPVTRAAAQTRRRIPFPTFQSTLGAPSRRAGPSSEVTQDGPPARGTPPRACAGRRRVPDRTARGRRVPVSLRDRTGPLLDAPTSRCRGTTPTARAASQPATEAGQPATGMTATDLTTMDLTTVGGAAVVGAVTIRARNSGTGTPRPRAVPNTRIWSNGHTGPTASRSEPSPGSAGSLIRPRRTCLPTRQHHP